MQITSLPSNDITPTSGSPAFPPVYAVHTRYLQPGRQDQAISIAYGRRDDYNSYYCLSGEVSQMCVLDLTVSGFLTY